MRHVLRRPLEHPEIEAIIQPPYRIAHVCGWEFHLVFGHTFTSKGGNFRKVKF